MRWDFFPSPSSSTSIARHSDQKLPLQANLESLIKHMWKTCHWMGYRHQPA